MAMNIIETIQAGFAKLEAMIGDRKAYNAQIEELTNSLNAATEAMNNSDSKVSGLQALLDLEKEKVAKLEGDLESMTAERDKLKATIEDPDDHIEVSANRKAAAIAEQAGFNPEQLGQAATSGDVKNAYQEFVELRNANPAEATAFWNTHRKAILACR